MGPKLVTMAALGGLVMILGACAAPAALGPRVHVELNDGQVLVGEMSTPALSLKTQFGAIAFDAAQAGELGPLEGGDIREAGSLIRLWLRNGSEFVGEWQAPVVRMALRVGGAAVPVDVPIQKLARLRFLGQPVWHDRPVFRLLTHAGDDFYVDAERSRVRLKTEVGAMEPFLDEIARLEPRGQEENAWQVVLKSGSVLFAEIDKDGLDLRPVLGPEKLTVAWSAIRRLEQVAAPALAAAAQAGSPPVQAAESAAYYDNAAQRAHKASEASTWR
jgi:hypothetical protein